MEIIKKQIAYNRSIRDTAIKYIVIHDTGNTANGADAESHYRYFNTGNRRSSADFFVDDTCILQVNNYSKYYSWHCGDGMGKYGITNANSIGIEICINTDGDYDTAFDNAVALTRCLMKELSIPLDRVVRHYDASRKNCPQSMNNGTWALWTKFKELLQEDIDMEELNELKKRVKVLENPMVYNYMDDNMPSWAKPTIQKLMDKGILVGDEEGRLGLTMDMIRMCVVFDRAGLF